MSESDPFADLAVDQTFATFGRAASYRPPEVGGRVACTIIRISPDVSIGAALTTRAVARSLVFEVRACEIRRPVREGIFTVGNEDYRVTADPKAEDPDNRVWSCVVTKI